MRWIVEGDEVLGGIAVRTLTNDKALRLGHVAYGIRPSTRTRGIATWALGPVLPRARSEGLGRVLLVCPHDNTVSIKTIEGHGEVLEKVGNGGHRLVRHSWIDLKATSSTH